MLTNNEAHRFATFGPLTSQAEAQMGNIRKCLGPSAPYSYGIVPSSDQ